MLFKLITKPIGCFFSFISTLVVLALLLAGGLWLGIHYLLGSMVSGVVQERTGFGVHVGETDNSVFAARFALKDVSVSNPAEYPTGDFVLFNELVLDFEPHSSGDQAQVVLERVVVDVARLRYVENSTGQANLAAFARGLLPNAFEVKQMANIVEAGADQEPAQRLSVLVRSLTLRVGKVSVEGAGGVAQAYALDYEKTFEDVTEFSQVLESLKGVLRARGLGQVAGALE